LVERQEQLQSVKTIDEVLVWLSVSIMVQTVWVCLHMVWPMPLPSQNPIVFCLIKIQMVLPVW